MKKILIINPYGIGDVLFTTPVISNLRRAYPQATIAYLANPARRIFFEVTLISGRFLSMIAMSLWVITKNTLSCLTVSNAKPLMSFLIFLSTVPLGFCLLPAGSKSVSDLIIGAAACF